MKKLLVLVAIAAYSIPTLTFAAYNDVSLTTDAVISVGGYTLNVSGSSATIQSIVVDTNSFSVTLASGSSFKVSSPVFNKLNSDITSDVTSNVCNVSESSITLSYSGGGTVTNVITPSSDTCSVAARSGGGGGGNASGSVATPTVVQILTATTTPPVVAPTHAPTPAISFTRILYMGLSGTDVSQLQQFLEDHGFYSYPTITGYFGAATKAAVIAFQKANGIEPLGGVGPLTQAKIRALDGSVSGSTSTSTPASPVAFTRDLHLGSTGEDVRALQTYLNAQGFPVSATGAGSAGNETTYFGPATRAALVKLQEAHASDILAPGGLTRGTGYFGPSTRAFVKQL